MPYIPAHDSVSDRELLLEFIAAHPLAMVITHDGVTPENNLIPLVAVADADAPCGVTLVGHVARGNRLWQDGMHEGKTLASFGPVEHYISPTWYPSKAEHHRTVPTWNYLVAHAWGELRIHDNRKWVMGAAGRLTTAMERGRDEPWRMNQAPADYLDDMLEQIVGIELPVERLVGRFKVSSHKTKADRLGARDGVIAESGESELTEFMAAPPQPHEQ